MSAHSDLVAQLRIQRDDEEDRPPRRRRRRGPWIVAASLLLIALAAVVYLVAGPRLAPPEVTVAEVRAGTGAAGGTGVVLEASGYVVARRRATVSSKITGRVDSILVQEGERVEAGQVVARLDASALDLQRRLAAAQLATVESSGAELEVDLAQARQDLARQERLLAEGVSSRTEFEAARTRVELLEARLAVVRDEVASARLVLRLRDQDLADTVIRTPFSGVVVSLNAQPGEMISPTTAGGGFTRTGICTVVDMSSLEVEVDVNESFINRITPDQPVTITLDAYPDRPIVGRVITIVPTADRTKATVKVRIAFAEEQQLDWVLPDMGARVRFLDPEDGAGGGADAATPARPGLDVPLGAVHGDDRGRAWVWVVDASGRVERRDVELAGSTGTRMGLTGGVRAGERVVVESPVPLEEGLRVRPAGD